MLIILYLAALVAANLLVARFGPSVTILNAFLFIGLDLTTRDALHDRWQGRALWPRMLALVLFGSALSYALNRHAGQIALASCVAFLLAGLADAAVYHVARRRPWFQRVNGSNVVSAAVDSVTFPTIAFGGVLPWVMLGQFVAKVLGGFVWAIVLRYARRER